MEYTNSQIRKLIEEWIHSERDRMILSDRLIDGLTFDKLAEKHDMSDRQHGGYDWYSVAVSELLL